MNHVVRAVLSAASEATGARGGWVVRLTGDDLEVVEAVGEAADLLAGAVVPSSSGSAGFVVGSGQPIAVTPRGGDPQVAEGLASMLTRPPASILSVPCATDDGVIGALELVDKQQEARFSFDDLELATLLAGIAAAALESEHDGPSAPDPRELAGELGRLAAEDPARYAAIAAAISALLAGA